MAKKPEKIIIPDEKTMLSMVAEYSKLKEQEKLIKERKDLISSTIKEYVQKYGTKDGNGSFYCESPDFVFGSQCRRSVKFNDEQACAYFQSKGFDDCVNLVPTVNQEAVDKRLESGDLSEKEIKPLLKISSTMAVDVRVKEVMPEVQQTVAVAASKKKRLFKKKKE